MLALIGLAMSTATAWACPGLEPCTMAQGEGAYYAFPPPGWDGERPLPAVIFFHGYGPAAADLAVDPAFTAPFAAEGVLLVLPESVGPGWGRQRPTRRGRDEAAFTDAMRADLVRRFPIDPARLLVSGFSAGGILALDLACNRGHDYAGFVVIAGAFRLPIPEGCPGGPASVLQIQGLTDDAVPIGGTPADDRIQLAGILPGMATLRRLDGCAEQPARIEANPPGQSCRVWDGCASGRELRLCLHPDGHLIPPGWVHQAMAWLQGLSAPARTH